LDEYAVIPRYLLNFAQTVGNRAQLAQEFIVHSAHANIELGFAGLSRPGACSFFESFAGESDGKFCESFR